MGAPVGCKLQTIPYAKPDAVPNVTLTRESNNKDDARLSVSWKHRNFTSAETGGSTIQCYEVRYKRSASQWPDDSNLSDKL